LENWPVVEEKKINKKLEEQEQAVEKLSEDINHIVKMIKTKIKKVFVYVLPNEKEIYVRSKNLIEKKTGLSLEIYAVNDKDKHDPKNKSKKVKPGRPGIYLE
jgi:restriction endonuclease S subunit